ncbi:MAG: hypothetical protein Aurels2KO_53890 [Aureliella sp.]
MITTNEDEAIIETLTAQLTEAQAAQEEAEAVATERRDRVKRLEAALAGFTGKPLKRVGQRARSVGGQNKSFAKKEDILSVCKELAEANPSIPQSDLEALTKDKLKDTLGFSLSGVPRLLKEILSSDTFSIDTNGGVSVTAS